MTKIRWEYLCDLRLIMIWVSCHHQLIRRMFQVRCLSNLRSRTHPRLTKWIAIRRVFLGRVCSMDSSMRVKVTTPFCRLSMLGAASQLKLIRKPQLQTRVRKESDLEMKSRRWQLARTSLLILMLTTRTLIWMTYPPSLSLREARNLIHNCLIQSLDLKSLAGTATNYFLQLKLKCARSLAKDSRTTSVLRSGQRVKALMVWLTTESMCLVREHPKSSPS